MTDLVQIEKVNEVYSRVRADPGVIMEMSDFFTFMVPGAQFTPKYKARVWDGKIRLLHALTGQIYAGLNRHIEEFCKQRDYDLEYTYDNETNAFSLKEAEDFAKKLKLPFEVRDYQIEAFAHAVRENRSLLLSPTASGKSLIIYLLVRYYAVKTLIIVPTTSLVFQLASDFADYGFDSDRYIHRVTAGVDKGSKLPITISTWQSIYKQPKEYFDQYDLVIGDEAHLYKAKSLTTILGNLTECKYRFGLTGTLDGSETNKLVLEGLFGPVRKVTSTKELMEYGHVSELKIKAVVLSHNEEARKKVAATDYQGEMDYLVRDVKRNKFIKNLVLSLKGNTLLLFQYVDKHGKQLYNDLTAEYPDRTIFFVAGEVKADEREEIRRLVENEDNAIIVASYGTFSTGINIKKLNNVIFASPSKSIVRILQSIGRTLRLSKEKEFATLIDIADDLNWKTRKNFTLLHFMERIRLYSSEKFKYKIYNVTLS